MRLGCNSRISGVIGLFFCLYIFIYPFYAHAILPLLASRAVLSTVISRVVVNRAVQSATADVAYPVLVSNTRKAISQSILKKSASIPADSFYRGVSGGLTWAGIAYSAGQLSADYFSGNDYIVATEGRSNGDGTYTVTIDGVDYISDFMPSKSNPFIALVGAGSEGATIVEQGKVTSEMGPFFYYITSNKIAYGGAQAVANAVLSAKDFSSFCKGRDNCTTSTGIKSIVRNGPFSAAVVTYDLNVTFKKSNGEMTTITTTYKFQLSYNSDYSASSSNDKDYQIASDKDGYSALDKLKNISLSLDELSALVNKLLLDASSEPDYKGIPFSPSNPVTSTEISKVYPNSGTLNKFDWLYPAQNSTSSDVNISVDNATSTLPDEKPSEPSKPNDTDIKVDLGDFPTPTEPDISNIPTAFEILRPITELFPFLKGFDIDFSARSSVSCPVASFELFGKVYTVDTQCILFEQNRGLIQLVSSIVWAFISIRIILSA